MKGFLIGLAVLIVIVIIGVLVVVSGMNRVVGFDEQVKAAWAQVENQLQRRFDLIPNLVNTVKGVAAFEKETYTAVTEARAKVGQIKITPEMLSNSENFKRFQAAQDELGGALSRLLVAVENYPQLKANENFLQLQAQLEGTENRIAVERMRYNETARNFNYFIRSFPGSVWASLRGLSAQKAYFEAAPSAKEAPRVAF